MSFGGVFFFSLVFFVVAALTDIGLPYWIVNPFTSNDAFFWTGKHRQLFFSKAAMTADIRIPGLGAV